MSPVLLAAFFASLWFVLLLVSLHRGWFSRLPKGFHITLLVTLIGGAIVEAFLISSWGYVSAMEILKEQVKQELENIDRLLESGIDDAALRAQEHLSDAAGVLSEHAERKAWTKAGEVTDLILRLEPLFLRIGVFDGDGRPVSAQPAESAEPFRVPVAFALDGQIYKRGPYFSKDLQKDVLQLAIPIRISESEIAGALVAWFDIEEELSRRFSARRFGESGYAVITNSRGSIIAHPDPNRKGDDISGYRAVQLALDGAQGLIEDLNDRGEERLFFYSPLQSPGNIDAQIMVLLIELGEDEATAPARRLLHEFYIGLAIVVLGALLLGSRLSSYIQRPVSELAAAVHRVEQGDLTTRIPHTGEDEFGQLGQALNRMVAGLEERDRVKELFGRYVTTQVSEEVLKGKFDLGGEARRVTILFSDIRDFTAMSEQMPPREVVSFLNEYFSEMVEAVFEYRGVLDKFLGDGMMAVFGCFEDDPDHPLSAVLAALRMQALLAKINGERSTAGKSPIRIGVGIHTEEVVVGNIGSRKRQDFTVVGDGVNTASRVEALNKEFGTTILITEATYETVQDRIECRPMPEAKLKGKVKTIRFYEVLSARAR